MKNILKIIGGISFLLLIVLIVKTLSNKPIVQNDTISLVPLPEHAIQHISEAIQMATETPNDFYQYDSATFFAYRKFIERTYPLVHQKLTRTIIDSFHYIYEWKGTDTSKLPIVLMAHYDVVPVESSA
ncbi:MAG: hypothetical protein ACK42B_09325, partial [Chitinophagaceae bacterium]